MKILFVGDVVLAAELALKPGERFRSLISDCDYACCNIEGPVEQGQMMEQPKRGPHLKNCAQLTALLKGIGFNIATIANNHIMDYGAEGLRKTMDSLDSSGMLYVGAGLNEAAAYQYLVLKNDMKVAIVSVAEKQFGASEEGKAGFAWMYSHHVYRQIRKAREECNTVIVLCHCGAEDVNIPLPEVRNLYKQFIDFGADLVIGNHPHVIQGSEIYKDKTIFYSLGNFIWDYDNLDAGQKSLAVVVDIKKGGEIAFQAVEIFYRLGEWEIMPESLEYNQANAILKNEKEYINYINQYCMNFYEKYLKSYYAQIIGFDLNNVKNQKLFCEHRKAGDPILWDDLFVYTNASTETNRWIGERAISLIPQ